jgi:hypothetical protein
MEMGQDVGWALFQTSQRTDLVAGEYSAILKSSKQGQCTKTYRS